MLKRNFILIGVLLLSLQTTAFEQGQTKLEYGIGIASIENPYQVSLTFFSQPSSASDTIALFHGEALRFMKDNLLVRSFDQMIELGYDEIGFPILGFNHESTWVKVSLNCHNRNRPPLAWIPRYSKNLSVRSWTDIFRLESNLFFIKQEFIAFYSKPDTKTRIRLKLKSKDRKFNYIMRRKQIRGHWMQVEVESPSSLCGGDQDVLQEFGVLPTKWIVWIQFLNERKRPRVFYYTRGC